MPDPPANLTPADPLAFALRYHGRKRVHNADEIMAEVVAKRLVEHLERAGFVVMQRAWRRRRFMREYVVVPRRDLTAPCLRQEPF